MITFLRMEMARWHVAGASVSQQYLKPVSNDVISTGVNGSVVFLDSAKRAKAASFTSSSE
jgi:hypothetical protein